MDTKVCSRCGSELPIDSFYKNNATKDGFDVVCKTCKSNYNKQYHRKKKALKEAAKLVVAKVDTNKIEGSYNLAKIEKEAIVSCISNNRDKSFSEYAEMLGISERTLYRKIHCYDLKELITNIKSFSEMEMADAISGIHLARVKTLADYDDKELLEELWKREYDGTIWKMVRKEATISKLFGKKK